MDSVRQTSTKRPHLKSLQYIYENEIGIYAAGRGHDRISQQGQQRTFHLVKFFFCRLSAEVELYVA